LRSKSAKNWEIIKSIKWQRHRKKNYNSLTIRDRILIFFSSETTTKTDLGNMFSNYKTLLLVDQNQRLF
jgi:hypothetical protein